MSGTFLDKDISVQFNKIQTLQKARGNKSTNPMGTRDQESG